jgi:hypothetical protein
MHTLHTIHKLTILTLQHAQRMLSADYYDVVVVLAAVAGPDRGIPATQFPD